MTGASQFVPSPTSAARQVIGNIKWRLGVRVWNQCLGGSLALPFTSYIVLHRLLILSAVWFPHL